jgi:HPt (histidine-containing phosphotransfer) domain-containing protein
LLPLSDPHELWHRVSVSALYIGLGVTALDDYVPKPVKPEELGEVLKRWVPQEGAIDAAGCDDFANPTETHDIIDRAVIENLKELGGPEMFSELAEMFCDDATSSLRALREAAEGGNTHSVERIAHTLKGSSGNMGAKGMARICPELQDVGVSGDLSRALQLFDQLEEEFGRVSPALQAEVARGQS